VKAGNALFANETFGKPQRMLLPMRHSLGAMWLCKACRRLGIHLRRSNEFGLYGRFMDEDGKTYDSYYRTDLSFESEVPLDPLRGMLSHDLLSGA
jgi:hypothetical protein